VVECQRLDNSVPGAEKIANNVYSNAYFGLTYLCAGLDPEYDGPPPSDSGHYYWHKLDLGALLREQAEQYFIALRMFFTLTPTANAMELLNYTNTI